MEDQAASEDFYDGRESLKALYEIVKDEKSYVKEIIGDLYKKKTYAIYDYDSDGYIKYVIITPRMGTNV